MEGTRQGLASSTVPRRAAGFSMSHVHASFRFGSFKNRKLTHYIHLQYIYSISQFSMNT